MKKIKVKNLYIRQYTEFHCKKDIYLYIKNNRQSCVSHPLSFSNLILYLELPCHFSGNSLIVSIFLMIIV